jgi:uncharacterized repeat protein (TIGR01451 family)
MGLLVAGVMIGCESDQDRNRDRTTTSSTTSPRSTSRSDADAPASRRGQVQTQTLAFPTGNRSDSVILLEKRGPASVRVGAPIEYQITVTNISDQPLEQVVVHDALPQRFLASGRQQDSSAGLARGDQPGQPGQAAGPVQPGQEVFLYFAEPDGAIDADQPRQQPMQPSPAPQRTGPDADSRLKNQTMQTQTGNAGPTAQQTELQDLGTTTPYRRADRDHPDQSNAGDTDLQNQPPVPQGETRTQRAQPFDSQVRSSEAVDITDQYPRQSRQTLTITPAPEPQSMRAVDQPLDEASTARQGQARPGQVQELQTDEAGNITTTTDAGRNQTLAAAQTGSGQWFIGSLAPGESRTIALSGFADAPGMLQSCTTVSYQPAVCFATEVTQPLLRVERQVPQTVNACEPFTIRYRVTNVGTGPTSNVTIREELPEGLVQTRGERSATAGPIELRADDLRQGQSREFTVNAVAQRGGQFTTQAIAVDEQGNQIRSNATQITVRQATLQMQMQAPQQAYLGRNVPLRITLTNSGDAPAREVTIAHQLPAGARLAQTDNRAQQQRDSVVWQVGTIPAGQSVTLDSALSIGQPGDVTVQAVAQGLCVADAATASATTAVTGLAAILLEVVDTQDPVPVGQQEIYRIRVTNQGTVPDTNIRLRVNLPAEMTLVSSAPGAAQAQGGLAGDAAQQPQPQAQRQAQGQAQGQAQALARADGNVVEFTIPSLAAGQTRELTITAQAQQAGDVRLQVEMTTDQLTRPVTETEATRLY